MFVNGNKQEKKVVYLGCIINNKLSTNGDILNRLHKTRIRLVILNNLWKNKIIYTATKIIIYNSNVKSILYIAET